MIREICYGLIGNIVFSLCLFTYKRYNHYHYDCIIERLNRIEEMIQDKPIHTKYFTNDKF